MVQNELAHYGILGMKWGVRRSEAQLRRANGLVSTQKRKPSPYVIDESQPRARDIMPQRGPIKIDPKRGPVSNKIPKNVPTLKSKENPVKDMSDAELRQKINRLQMENQYSQLTKKKASAGQKFVTGVLITVGTQIATKYVSQYATKGIEAVGKKITNMHLNFDEPKIKA